MKSARSSQMNRTILAIDVGVSHIKMMSSKDRIKREFESAPDLTAKQMVRKVKALTKDWSYHVISIGYPGLRRSPADAFEGGFMLWEEDYKGHTRHISKDDPRYLIKTTRPITSQPMVRFSTRAGEGRSGAGFRGFEWFAAAEGL